jgi:hypothetical protein
MLLMLPFRLRFWAVYLTVSIPAGTEPRYRASKPRGFIQN